MTHKITLKPLTDADIDRHYSKGSLIQNAAYRHMTVAEYRKWLKGTA